MISLRTAAALAALALMPAAAQAQTTITACYVPNSGSVYRIKAAGTPSTCKQNHVEFSWETGLSIGYSVRSSVPTGQPQFPGQTLSYYAYCLEGEVPVGGGFSAGTPVQVTTDRPFPEENGWVVTLINSGPLPVWASARVVCLALPN
jgi:hypothetical protein